MIGDRYILSGLHTSGSQSKIWKALDRISGANRIVKTGLEIKREALLARSLLHPLIAFPYDFGVDPELGEYAVYPEFQGATSLQWVKANGGRDQLKTFAAQVAEFLCFLHQRGWLYNDFKPEHFLVDDNRLKVLDLGLCSESRGNSFSKTFSGTFPYISPERLNGRPFDQRSDIFAFGVLLLHLLLSEEEVPVEPSQGALQTFLCKAATLKEPWKSLILQMTALEPSQRIANASELLKRITPGAAKSSHRPLNGEKSSLPQEAYSARFASIQSSSERTLDGIYNEMLLNGWENSRCMYAFDFSKTTPDEAFQNLCVALTGKSIPDRYTGFETFAERKPGPDVVVVFRMPELLPYEKRELFLFGLSCLAEYDWLKIVLLTSKSWSSFLTDSWKHFAASSANGNESQHSMEALSPATKKVLNALAVSGGALPVAALHEFCQARSVLELQHQGFVFINEGLASLSVCSELLLKRMRRSQKASTAERVLQTRVPKEAVTLHQLGVHSGKDRIAALGALLSARRVRDEAALSHYEWLWKAFLYNARLPRKVLFKLLQHSLRLGDWTKSQRLIKQIHQRFGDSYRLGDYRLDFYHRKYQIKNAIRIASRYVAVATKRGHEEMAQYYLVREAGFHVMNHDLERARQILDGIPQNIPERVKGLYHHYLGLLHFFHGNLSDSLEKTRIACRLKHRFRFSSMMNMAVVLGKMGRYEKAEKYLHRCIQLFSKIHDQDRLSRAFNNLGLVYLGSGRSALSKKSFIQSYHLARACKNPGDYIVALTNVARVYEREGRMDRSVAVHSKAFRLSRKFKLRKLQSASLVNGGLHLAYMGRFRRSVKLLKRAIQIRSKLELQILKGHACESLAITYLLARRFQTAEKIFLKSKQIFQKAACEIDPMRVDAWLAIVALEMKDVDRGAELLGRVSSFQPNSFEEGLASYTRAFYLLHASPDKNCLAAIHDAERIFRKVPALFWLAKTHKLKSDFYRKNENFEKSILSLQSAYHLFSRLGARRELQNLPKEGMDMRIYEDFLEQLSRRLPYKALQMVKEILSVQEVDSMVTKILDTALELTSMDRAMLILNEEPLRVFKTASLDDSNIEDVLDVSRSVLKSATDSGKSVLCFDASVDPMLQHRPSIINNRILSVVCLPLKDTSGKTVGCLYLDSCEGVETLAETERILLEIFSAIVGLALSQSLILEKSVAENKELRSWLELRKECPEMIGNSPAIHQVLRMAQSVVDHSLPILITGETGTGKELVARVLHYSSKRKNGPFVAVNCAAFSRELLESELFGHEKGSFTGAMQQKKGVFEQAQNGTLLLDEIGEMPLEMQAKLLRVLQGGEFRRIGGTQTLSTNARVILATNRNLEEMVGLGTFREDLFYRIKVVEIAIPPLRHRIEDIPLLATAFLRQTVEGTGKKFVGFTHEALEFLKHYSWPGNIRQLRSEIERIVALNNRELVTVEDLDPRILQSAKSKTAAKAEMVGSLSEIEKRVIVERLNAHQWNVVLAARSLGITRHGLYSKMKRYQITNPNR